MATDVARIENALKPLLPMFEQITSPLRRYGVDPGRIMRSVLISCDRTPILLDCDLQSILQAATTGAMLGLEADGVTGQGFLIPFRQKGHGRRAQWVTGYMGYNTLAARVGLTLNGEVVRSGDLFEFEEGSNGFVKHKKLLNQRGRDIVAAWATASAFGRPAIVKVMDMDDILAVKAKSRAAQRDADKDDEGDDGGTFSPWNDPKIGFPAMAAKTPKRRLRRDLPLSSFVHAAVIDEAHEERGRYAFMHPDRGVVIDGDDTAPPLVPGAQPGPRIGPGITQIKRPEFKITGGREDIVLPTIEQWRSRWLEEAAKLGPDAARKLYDRNEALFEDYREHSQAAVNDVVVALRGRF